MSAPRWMHRIYAALAGYFWLPCPLCHESFGGHEASAKPGHSIFARSGGNGRAICPCCAEAGYADDWWWDPKREVAVPKWSAYH